MRKSARYRTKFKGSSGRLRHEANPSFICPDVRVRNLNRATRFYRALGLRSVAEARMGDGTEIAWLRHQRTGQLLELFQLSRRSPMYRPFRSRAKIENSLIFSLPDGRSLLPRLFKMGASRVREIEDGDVLLTFVRDPDGTLIEFVSWTAASRKDHRRPPMLGLAIPRSSRWSTSKRKGRVR
jgi:catechol 2,3-dioxygenase-like lactoylglutathione lyase family enzyme